MGNYKLVIHNSQGASESYQVSSIKEAQASVSSWGDTENMTAKLYDMDALDAWIMYKPFGRRTLRRPSDREWEGYPKVREVVT